VAIVGNVFQCWAFLFFEKDKELAILEKNVLSPKYFWQNWPNSPQK
jgi:hypothetical protein